MTSYRGQAGGGGRPQPNTLSNRPQGGPPPVSGLSAEYPGEYFDSKGNIRGDLITSLAEHVAQTLGSVRATNNKIMAYGQLRKFYDQAVAVKLGLEAGQDFSTLRPKLLSLVPAAANAVGAGNAPQLLKQFIEANVGIAKRDEKHFRAFMTHFQSVVAYYKYYFPRG